MREILQMEFFIRHNNIFMYYVSSGVLPEITVCHTWLKVNCAEIIFYIKAFLI